MMESILSMAALPRTLTITFNIKEYILREFKKKSSMQKMTYQHAIFKVDTVWNNKFNIFSHKRDSFDPVYRN